MERPRYVKRCYGIAKSVLELHCKGDAHNGWENNSNGFAWRVMIGEGVASSRSARIGNGTVWPSIESRRKSREKRLEARN